MTEHYDQLTWPLCKSGSEDCLYLAIVSRPWTSGVSPLKPVVVSFYGGGFVYGGASFSTLPPPSYPILNVSSTTDFIFVYPNYRVNVFGFLSGAQVAADPESDANAGLLDQLAALRWVQQNIAKFGGDPGKVTIWGQSAGAGSVVAQVLAQRRRLREKPGEKPLFHAALASSPYWPKTYSATGKETQALFDAMVNMTGCENGTATTSALACLKAAPLSTIREANTRLVNSGMYSASQYTWAPVLDGKFLGDELLSQSADGGQGSAGQLRIWGMYNTREGDYFVPSALQSARSPPDGAQSRFNNSEAGFDTWLRGFLPDFGEEELQHVKEIYPAAGTTETLVYNATDYHTRAGLVYRDSTLACPAFWLVSSGGSQASQSQSWLSEYTMAPANHASDTEWVGSLYTIHRLQASLISSTDALTCSGTSRTRGSSQTASIMPALRARWPPSFRRAIRTHSS